MSTAGGVAATVAMIAAKQRQELLDRFRQGGALSASTALTLEQLEVGSNPMLRTQIRQGVVVEAGDGRHYLDQEIVAKQEYRRRMLVTGLTGTLVLALLVFWLVG